MTSVGVCLPGGSDISGGVSPSEDTVTSVTSVGVCLPGGSDISGGVSPRMQ